MASKKFHHRIPIVGRPFLQRNEARLQRDKTLQELARVGAERDEAWRERDKAWRERDKALALRRDRRVNGSEEMRAVQTVAKTRLTEEAEEETRTFQEESYRNLEFLNAPGGIAVGEPIDDVEIIRRVVHAYKSDCPADSKPTALWEVIYNTRQAPLHEILLGDDLTAIENFPLPGRDTQHALRFRKVTLHAFGSGLQFPRDKPPRRRNLGRPPSEARSAPK